MSLLSSLFVPDRMRPRAGDGGMARPIMIEVPVPEGVDPLLVTNTDGLFLASRRAQSGIARCAFTHCPWQEEGALVRQLYLAVANAGGRWSGSEQSLEAALARVGEPRAVVAPADLLVPEGVTRHVLPLDPGCALVFAEPTHCGLYLRVGDHAAVIVQRVGQAVVAVSR